MRSLKCIETVEKYYKASLRGGSESDRRSNLKYIRDCFARLSSTMITASWLARNDNLVFFRRSCIILFISVLAVISSITVPSLASEYKDGEYKGGSKNVDVRVTIENGQIAAIDILKHRGGGEEYLELIKPLTKQMVRNQTTRVDTVSGATVSSNDLKKAVNSALEKAFR